MGRLKSLPKSLAAAPNLIGAADRADAERKRSRARGKVADTLRGLYNTVRWRHPETGLRVQILNRANWMCEGCAKPHPLGGPKNGPNSPIVDHIRPHRGNLNLFWDSDNLQAVCKHYHDTTKQAQEAADRAGQHGEGWV